MPVKKDRLGFLNPVTSDQEKYLSSTRGSAELLRAVTGGGKWSNAGQLLILSEEQRDVKKAHDIPYDSRLKGLVINIQGANKRLIPRAKITGSWMSVRGNTVSGTVLSATEFRDF